MDYKHVIRFIILVILANLVLIPLEREVYKRIERRWLAWITTFVLGMVLLGILFGIIYYIVNLLGFDLLGK